MELELKANMMFSSQRVELESNSIAMEALSTFLGMKLPKENLPLDS